MSNQGSGTSRPSRYFLKNALRPLGMRWLGGKDIAFVLRNEKFYKLVKGPGWLFLVPLLDSVAFTTESLPDSLKEMFLNIQTQDGLLVSVEAKLEFLFDPFQLKLPTTDHARVAKRCQHVAERRVVVQDQAQRALQEVMSAFPSQLVCAGGPKMWAALEQPLWRVLNDKLKPFGMFLIEERSSVQAIIPPEKVRQQMELSAERLLSAMMLGQLSLSQQAQVLRAEAIAALKTMTGGSPYLNLHDFAVSAEQQQPGLQVPEQQQLIEGVVRPINPDDTANTSPKIVLKPDPVPKGDLDDTDDDVRSMLE